MAPVSSPALTTLSPRRAAAWRPAISRWARSRRASIPTRFPRRHPGALVITITGNATPATAYWTGTASTALADAANQWGNRRQISTSNWSTTPDGLTDPKQVPGPITNVYFTAANATGVSGSLTTTLDTSYSINSLTFAVPSTTSISSVAINTNGNAPGHRFRRADAGKHVQRSRHDQRFGQRDRQRQPELGQQSTANLWRSLRRFQPCRARRL